MQNARRTPRALAFSLPLLPLPRRAVLRLLLALLPASARSEPPARAAAALLRLHAAPYLRAVAPLAASAVLWRGAEHGSPSAVAFAKRGPAPDLLDPATYGEEGAKFFAALEGRRVSVRPSRAHVASGDRAVAEQWGRPVTVWPLGEFRYAYWRDGTLIYEEGESLADAERVKGPFVCDEGLRQAIGDGREVMFEADAFVEIGERLLPNVLTQLLSQDGLQAWANGMG